MFIFCKTVLFARTFQRSNKRKKRKNRAQWEGRGEKRRGLIRWKRHQSQHVTYSQLGVGKIIGADSSETAQPRQCIIYSEDRRKARAGRRGRTPIIHSQLNASICHAPTGPSGLIQKSRSRSAESTGLHSGLWEHKPGSP